MNASIKTLRLPPSHVVLEQIAAAEDEIKALKRVYRAARAAEKAEEARQRRLALQKEETSGA